MTHFWMACLMTNLQPHERERNRPRYHWGKYFFFIFLFLLLWPLLCFIHVIRRRAAHRKRSSAIAFTFQNVSSNKMLSVCVIGWPSLDHSAERTVFQPLLPAASSDQKQTEIAQADPTGFVSLTRQQQRNNRLYLSAHLKTPRVCIHIFHSLGTLCIYMLTRNSTNY